jgi:hypothetical protein
MERRRLTSKVFWALSLLVLFIVSCKVSQRVPKVSDISYLPIKKSDFIVKPFGYEPTIKNFTQKFVPPFKIQRFVVPNKHDPKQNDTIVKFYQGKTELFIYKTKFNQELFFAGNIYYKNIVFCNGVKVGIFRGEFFNCFTDLKYSQNDTVKIVRQGQGDTYKFVFKKEKLENIIIQHYID